MGFPKISVRPGNDRIYLFEFLETKEKGLFVSDVTGVTDNQAVEVLILDKDDNEVINLIGNVKWINADDDVGVGLVFNDITIEEFRLSMEVLGRVAYI